MKAFMYTVYDSCSGVYDRPFVCNSDGEAMRAFGDIAINAEHPIGAHPEHYTLFRIALYDNNKGVIEGHPPEFCCTALEMVAESRAVDKTAHMSLLKEVN